MNFNVSFLNDLYPADHAVSATWKPSLYIGLFVFLFLLIFQPFGLTHELPYKFWIILGYGVITSIGIWVFHYSLMHLFSDIFEERKWYLWKEILYSMSIIVFIAILNLLYSASLGFFALTLESMAYSLFMTASLGVFPVTLGIIINYYFHLKKNVSEANFIGKNINKSPLHSTGKPKKEKLMITNAEGTEKIPVSASDLIRIEAAQNYVEVVYLEEGEMKRTLLRNTLKAVSDQLKSYPFLVQTHRSHLINLKKVDQIEGNAQGLQLRSKVLDNAVPVSRSKISRVKRAMAELQNKEID